MIFTCIAAVFHSFLFDTSVNPQKYDDSKNYFNNTHVMKLIMIVFCENMVVVMFLVDKGFHTLYRSEVLNIVNRSIEII